MFLIEKFGGTKNPQLIKSKKDDKDTANAAEKHSVFPEELACRSKSEPQKEKCKTDAQHKESGIQ